MPGIETERPRVRLLRCPGEVYTITEHICRARQEKHYEKCPECPVFRMQPPRMAPTSLFYFKAKTMSVVTAGD